ncbi:MAG: iodotyrosine deiodinase [Bacteroidota bacterium]|nr:iodotyrosine deiodinase [Bacteroidota bacterium]
MIYNYEQLIGQANTLIEKMRKRRSVRRFSGDEIPIDIIKGAIKIASLAPSGANMQPWTFVLVQNPEMKIKIREKAEEIEKSFYEKKISTEWKSRLEPLGTNWQKPFLTEAPYLICVFMQKYGIAEDGSNIKHYYPQESVGISTGFLIMTLHLLGISSLTYSPSPNDFLREMLGRPENEKPFTILVTGYPHSEYIPPSITKKQESEYLKIF